MPMIRWTRDRGTTNTDRSGHNIEWDLHALNGATLYALDFNWIIIVFEKGGITQNKYDLCPHI